MDLEDCSSNEDSWQSAPSSSRSSRTFSSVIVDTSPPTSNYCTKAARSPLSTTTSRHDLFDASCSPIRRPDSLNGVSLADLDIDALLEACMAPLPERPCVSTIRLSPEAVYTRFDPERTPRPEPCTMLSGTPTPRSKPLHDKDMDIKHQVFQDSPNSVQHLRLKQHQTHSDVLSFPLPPSLATPLAVITPLSPTKKSSPPPVPVKDRQNIPAPLKLTQSTHRSPVLLPSPTISDFTSPPTSPEIISTRKSSLCSSQISSSSSRTSEASFNWSASSRSTGASTPEAVFMRKSSSFGRNRAGSDFSFSSFGHCSTSSLSSAGPLTPPVESADAEHASYFNWDDFASPVWQHGAPSSSSLQFSYPGPLDDNVSPAVAANLGRKTKSPKLTVSPPKSGHRTRTSSATSDNTMHTITLPDADTSTASAYAAPQACSSSSEDLSRCATPLSIKSNSKSLKSKKSLAAIGKIFNGLRKSPSQAQLRSSTPSSRSDSPTPSMPKTPVEFL